VTTPGPLRLRDVARRMHLPEAEVRASANALCRNWGSDRVLAPTDGDTVRLTPAAVLAIHQAFGLSRLSQPRRRAS
jgi:hypothetical protein